MSSENLPNTKLFCSKEVIAPPVRECEEKAFNAYCKLLVIPVKCTSILQNKKRQTRN